MQATDHYIFGTKMRIEREFHGTSRRFATVHEYKSVVVAQDHGYFSSNSAGNSSRNSSSRVSINARDSLFRLSRFALILLKPKLLKTPILVLKCAPARISL